MMNLDQLKALLLSIDPHTTKYYFDGDQETGTIWTPHHPTATSSDDMPEDHMIKVTISHYSHDPDDPIPGQIIDALESRLVSIDDPIDFFDQDENTHRTIIEGYFSPGKD